MQKQKDQDVQDKKDKAEQQLASDTDKNDNKWRVLSSSSSTRDFSVIDTRSSSLLTSYKLSQSLNAFT